DLAYTAWTMGSGVVQLAFSVETLDQLKFKIKLVLNGKRDTGIYHRGHDAQVGKTAYLFSGQGSQYPGMLRDLFVYFPALQSVLAEGAAYTPAMYPATVYDDASRKQQQRALTDTRQAQPALGLVESALFRWLTSFNLKPDMAAGHSYGELVALATAGAFDLTTLIELSSARAAAMMAVVGADAGKMAAVSLDVPSLQPLLADFPNVVMANQNSPTQTVISGSTVEVERAVSALKAQGISAQFIETACAFHSPMMAAAGHHYAQSLAQHEVWPLKWPVYSNQSATQYESDAVLIRSGLADHIVSPVRFVAEIEQMYKDGARTFVEIGPRKVLTNLVGRILGEQPHTAIALDQEGKGLAGLFDQLAKISVCLPDFDASPLFHGRSHIIDLNKPKLLSASTWMVNGGRAWPLK
ncbi:MAG: acyltransferase domain-containing protein, partial [Flavobacteriales bacterium]